MTTRRPMVAGNWKMNGNSAANDQLLAGIRDALHAQALDGVDIVVSPPYPYLALTQSALQSSGLHENGVQLSAQNVAAQSEGAFTGEVAAPMLRDVGCQWVIIGHSERRTLYAETDALVVEKTRQALASGLGVIVCVGETGEQRKAGQTEAVLGAQVDAVVNVFAGETDVLKTVIAYEPVWAIGTGETATPDMAQSAHKFIRSRLDSKSADGVRLLYGGSVKPNNAAELFAQPDIDGGLIGGASLVASDFLAICRAAV